MITPIVEELSPVNDAFAAYGAVSDKPYSFFLDSGMDPHKLGRFSFIGADPFLLFTAAGRKTRVNRLGWEKTFYGNPFYILKSLLSEYKTSYRNADFPFWGGAVGYFSYDLKDCLEKLPDISVKDTDIPDCSVGFYDTVLIFDNLKKKAFIASSGFPERGKKRRLRARARLEKMKDLIIDSSSRRLWRRTQNDKETCHSERPTGAKNLKDISSTFTKEQYISAILKAKEYIRKGDIYQVNLSQRFHADFDGGAFALYSALRSINPAPFAAFLNFGDTKIASSSPERFMKIEGRKIQTRPMKGTRPRGRTKEEDAAFKKELLTSEKDRAENLMIIDLERNDLGRICEYGSVKVSEFMACEEYKTVFQLTSGVEGALKKGLTACDMLVNCFPGGSITGAPKIRSMEIIEELEPVKRNLYTGSIGYIGFNGDMDSSIVIRTFVINKNKAHFSAGGGIVHDSDPEAEYRETLHKAKALIEALRMENSKLETLNPKQIQNSKFKTSGFDF